MKNLNELPLVYYSISCHCPSPTMKRKDLEEQIQQITGAEPKHYKISMQKIPKRWQDTITAAQAKFRNLFDSNCFRVNDRYALPVGEMVRFEAEINKQKAIHDAHVMALCEALASGELHRVAVAEVGRAIDLSGIDMDVAQIEQFVYGYLPTSCEEIKSRMYLSVQITTDLNNPIIDSALLELGEGVRQETIERVRADAERADAEGQRNIVSYVMDEVAEYLKDIQMRVGEGKKGSHYKTILDKFTRITQELPAYNVTGNPAISNAIERVYETFKGMDAEALKEDANYRSKQVESATELLSDLEEENLF